MNKKEAARTTVELTILASNLRRRRDEWKRKTEASERAVKALQAQVRGLEFAHKMAMAAVRDSADECRALKEKLGVYDQPSVETASQ